MKKIFVAALLMLAFATPAFAAHGHHRNVSHHTGHHHHHHHHHA
jgi:hypothetical protein